MFTGGNAAVWRRRQKGTGHRMVSCPLLTPLTFLCADTSEMCSETGVRGHDSVRRADFGTHGRPEFTLRSSPRITVRGQTVQGGSVPLRKAPLRSRIVPWRTRRPCGPLAFRRATEGRRGEKERLGSQEGQGNLGVPAPFAPAAGRRQCPACPSAANLACGGRPPERRNRSPSAEGKNHGTTLYRRKIP